MNIYMVYNKAGFINKQVRMITPYFSYSPENALPAKGEGVSV